MPQSTIAPSIGWNDRRDKEELEMRRERGGFRRPGISRNPERALTQVHTTVVSRVPIGPGPFEGTTSAGQ
jgi:hypothetical protein